MVGQDESPWVRQGDLQLQLGGNCYTDRGKEALDHAVLQHGGGMVVRHTHQKTLAEAQRDEEMREALALERRISALDAATDPR